MRQVNPSGFYAYVWYDPVKQELIYVGKGKGDRCFEKRRGRNLHLKNRLKTIENAGQKVQIGVYCCEDEELAFFVETEAIAKYGRRDLGLGPLLNLTNGGDGPAGSIQTPESNEKRRVKLTGQVRGPRSQEDKVSISDGLKGLTQTESQRSKRKKTWADKTDEQKQAFSEKMSTVTKGAVRSEEARANYRAAAARRKKNVRS